MVATNYPAFNWVNTHNATYAAQLGGSHLQWYMPSIAELCEVYKNRTAINASLAKIHGLTNGSGYADAQLVEDTYWSSSQYYNKRDCACLVDFSDDRVNYGIKDRNYRVCCLADCGQ